MRSRSSRWLPALVAVAALAAGCGGGASPSGPLEPAEAAVEETAVSLQDGGTVVYGADQEPGVLNPLVLEGGSSSTANLALAVLYPLWRVTPDYTYEPLLLAGPPEVTEDPFTVTYELREDATWSDGTPITADDVLFTIETRLDPDVDVVSREGYDRIDLDATEVVDDKTIRVVFTEPYAAWNDLFASADGAILPRHALEGADFHTVWDDAIVGTDGEPIASGPLQFESWDRGQQLVLARNEAFWGDPAPRLDRVVVRFIEDSRTATQQLRGGEVDVLYPHSATDLVEQVADLDDVTMEVGYGPLWEHLTFNLVVPGLDLPYVRQAIAQAIDREAIAQALLAGVTDAPQTLDNASYMANQAEYEPHFDRWAHDPPAAVALLEDNGCERGDDDVFVCDGQRLSFDYTTTAGNERRELQLEVVQAQLAEIGIEIVPATGDPATVFGPEVLFAGPQGAWELFNFGWSGGPDPAGGVPAWRCDGDTNFGSYCNEEVTALLEEADRTLDPERRARLFNEADALMAADLPLLPLYQNPQPLVYSTDLHGVRNNPVEQWGPLWNVEEWALAAD